MYNTKALESACQVTLLLQSDVYKIFTCFKTKICSVKKLVE